MDIALKYFEEAYTTEHWMVRIYRVLDKRAPFPRQLSHALHDACTQTSAPVFVLQGAGTCGHALQFGMPHPVCTQKGVHRASLRCQIRCA